MCTRYISPETGDIERFWHVGRGQPWRGGEVFPGYPGAFVRAARGSAEPAPETVVGQWSLIPWFAKERKLKFATCNARTEELAQKASYKHPWARGQRCLIPAWGFYEPNWESGRHVPWLFRRRDGTPWALAGLWNAWTDPASGEIVESYTMLTLNADAHPLMRRMHKPDPRLAPDAQDKRSVVAIAPEDRELWLFGRVEEARAAMRWPAEDEIDAGPAAPAPRGGPPPLSGTGP